MAKCASAALVEARKRPALAVRGQRRRSGSPLIYKIKWRGVKARAIAGVEVRSSPTGRDGAPRTPERRAAAQAFDGCSRQGHPAGVISRLFNFRAVHPGARVQCPARAGSGVRPRPGHPLRRSMLQKIVFRAHWPAARGPVSRLRLGLHLPAELTPAEQTRRPAGFRSRAKPRPAGPRPAYSARVEGEPA